ncbi:polyphosphate kinase 2, partial [mine drainage metagenome]
SWYNRAGVEWVMGFCTETQYEEFIETVPVFEQMLVRSGIHLFKYYLDIDKTEQKRRLKDRLSDPLKQWKMSPIDAVAQKHWKDYSAARNAMFARTHSAMAPWTVVRANDKKRARLSLDHGSARAPGLQGQGPCLAVPRSRDRVCLYQSDRGQWGHRTLSTTCAIHDDRRARSASCRSGNRQPRHTQIIRLLDDAPMRLPHSWRGRWPAAAR